MGCWSTIITSGFDMHKLTILSHNVFWFQGFPFPSDQPPAPDRATLQNLVGIYKKIAPDVIALQEIQSQTAFEEIAAQLGMEGCYCPGTTLSQYGGAIFWQGNHSQPLVHSSTCDKTQRVWQIIEIVRHQFHLRVANVHLPSARQLGKAGALKQRLAELERVLDATTPAPEVITGDFNEQPDGPVSAYLEQNGYIDAANFTQQADQATTLGSRRGDYIWFKQELAERVLTYKVMQKTELTHPDPHKQYLSDHLPLWVTLAC